ncbi:glycosyltransferase family 2 protein [Cellulophaga sp. BC115SP]|uniref:glycosyltransferase family 2 protein n=1 Tax=Cellulophaga sp. BC115SP TaxID=2683263 RepID=UPI00141265DB|nr:glycosyltransferase family 2 protein [Cellulophaga sp. BC115SP]NBB28218.1 hypothetical protein [Cellulophaga sp. BC115SP]
MELRYLIKTWRRSINQYIHAQKQKYIYDKSIKISLNNLHRIDNHFIPDTNDEIRLFAIIRNESLRLPHFLNYYKKLGVDRLFFIDNNSTDHSAQILLKESNTHLFYTQETYVNHWCWMEYLLDKYGKNHWCVVVDIDELFTFPYSEKLTLRDLIQYMNNENTLAIQTFLLDMYSNQSVQQTTYVAGQNPIDSVAYFDKFYTKTHFEFLNRKTFHTFYSSIFTGGVRDRVFGKTSPPHILSKIPFFKNVKGSYLVQGMHAIDGSKLSDIQGAVLHTKFLYDFIEEVQEETQRKQHFGGAFYYKSFKDSIDKTTALSLYNTDSIKYVDSQQLVELGIMKTNDFFNEFADKHLI